MSDEIEWKEQARKAADHLILVIDSNQRAGMPAVIRNAAISLIRAAVAML